MKTSKQILSIIIFSFILISCGGNSDKKDKKNNEVVSEKPTTDVKEIKVKAWEVVSKKDEFGNAIETKTIIMADFEGTMSNSSEAYAPFTVKMLVKDSTILSAFYDYNREPRAELPESKTLSIKMKLQNGEVVKAEQFLYENMMVDSNSELLNILLEQNEPIQAIADISLADEQSNTIYKFEINSSRLKEALKEMYD